MRKITTAALLALALPSFAASWTSYEQLQGAGRVNLRGDLELQSKNAGSTFVGARDADGAPAVQGGDASNANPKLEKPVLTKKDKIEPPGPAETKKLAIAQAVGGVALGAGLGLLGYSVLAAAGGPVVLAAALIFLGGMTVYLCHRRLTGKTSGIFG